MTGLLRNLDLPPALSGEALPLDRDGRGEVAWPRDAALRILDLLSDRAIAVLSGVVVDVERGRAREVYYRWQADSEPGESFPAFAARSQAEARGYVTGYSTDSPTHCFVLALADRLG